jgi:RND family efflux transporter MFP subunit
VNNVLRKYVLPLAIGGLWTIHCLQAYAQDAAVLVQVEKVRETRIERTLPLSGRIFSRNDASMSLTIAGELEWVLEPGTHVATGEVIAQLDQKPILLRKAELEHLTERERVNAVYLDKDLARLKSLRKDNNASERQVDEGESLRDISRLVQRSVQAKIDQVDDELRRSHLVAPFAAVIAARSKRGGEYAQVGEVIVRLVDLSTLELRFQMPVVYLGRIAAGDSVVFNAQSGQLSGARAADSEAIVRAVIPAANPSSQTFEVRANLDSTSLSEVIAGQLVNVAVPISGTKSTIQIPRDAIVLRAEGNYVFRISGDNTAQKVMVDVGEGSREWVSVKGDLKEGDSVAIRGVERLQDGQQVSRIES